jgi:3-deoxy-D-manno-octulosonic-acid transferase
VWFHGVSVGEVHLLRQVVAAFRRRHPLWDCVISTTTDTGHEEARKRFPELPVFFWPFDFSWAVGRALRRVRPRLVVLAEGEIWPNFVRAAQRQGVSVAVVNGRMSPRSFARYRRLGWLVRRLFARIDLFAVQTADYAASFRQLEAPADRVHVTGSVKYDGVESDRQNPRTQELRRLLGAAADDLVWIAGSTQAPEEEVALAVYQRARAAHPRLRLILVPRQKERFEEVAALLRRAGVAFVRRSELTGPVNDRAAVVLVDTIGELGALWGLADVAFVGGSLDGRRGGQNMIEPAAYGAAVVFGPHVWNFRDTAARLVQAGAALQVEDEAGLEATVRRLLGDAAERARLGEAARRLVQEQQGATERTVALLDGLLLTNADTAGRKVA